MQIWTEIKTVEPPKSWILNFRTSKSKRKATTVALATSKQQPKVQVFEPFNEFQVKSQNDLSVSFPFRILNVSGVVPQNLSQKYFDMINHFDMINTCQRSSRGRVLFAATAVCYLARTRSILGTSALV